MRAAWYRIRLAWLILLPCCNVALSRFGNAPGSRIILSLALLFPVSAAGAGFMGASAQLHRFGESRPDHTHRPQACAWSRACMLVVYTTMTPAACVLLEFTKALSAS